MPPQLPFSIGSAHVTRDLVVRSCLSRLGGNDSAARIGRYFYPSIRPWYRDSNPESGVLEIVHS